MNGIWCNPTSLFTNPDWFAKIQAIRISQVHFEFLFHALGVGLLEVNITVHDDDYDSNDEELKAQIWGSFQQFHPVFLKIEEQVFANIGMQFIFEGNCTLITGDDKLFHAWDKVIL